MDPAKRDDPGIMEAARRATERPIHWFTLPPAVAKEAGFVEIGMVILTPDEELNATRRARGDMVRLAYEYPQESLRRADQTPVSTGDGTSERVWAALGPKGRQLVMAAYGELHSPKEAVTEAFIKTVRVTAG